MITSGYCIDAYCDCVQCVTNIDPAGRWCKGEMASAVGESYAECARVLRGLGWELSRNRLSALAPGHKKPKEWGKF